jgi:hypothetical protein
MRLFDSDDYETLCVWFLGRGMVPPPLSSFPKTGFIEDMCAAGFLVETDTTVACIDFMISNPECAPKKRSEAIDNVAKMLIDHAKRKNYKYVKCATVLQSVVKRSEKLGFNLLGEFKTLIKEL